MAKLDIISFNYIASGTKQNVFNINYTYTNDGNIHTEIPSGLSAIRLTTFFGDIGTEETMSLTYSTNKTALYDKNNKHIIHNLYKLEKTPLRTTSEIPTKDVKQDFYLWPIKDDFLQFCQFKNYSYALTKQTTNYPIELSIEFNNKTVADYTYYQLLSAKTIDTYLYPSVKELTDQVGIDEISTYNLYVLQDPELSSLRLSSIFSPAKNLKNILYNYVVEIPVDTVLNDYEDGYVQANWFMLKNHLNELYDMDAYITDSTLSVVGCREYVNLNCCGGLLYATYRSNSSYKNKISLDSSQIVEGTKIIDMLSEKTEYSYQHVEVINSFHKYDASDKLQHKSSMYSLNLQDIGLNTTTINETVKAKLRKMIDNNIRNLVEKICPANTQLFNIYYKGK